MSVQSTIEERIQAVLDGVTEIVNTVKSKISGVTVDGVSIVDPDTKIANIETITTEEIDEIVEDYEQNYYANAPVIDNLFRKFGGNNYV